MLLAHKIALDPNMAQRIYFARAAGTARFAYNWALAERKRQYAAGEKPNETSLRRQLNAIKREQFPWMFDVTKCAPQEAIIDLGAAFRAFFEKRGRYPQFKSKSSRSSFCAANAVGTFRTDGERIKLPVIGWVRMREAILWAAETRNGFVQWRPLVRQLDNRHERCAAGRAASRCRWRRPRPHRAGHALDQ
jgi:putative transposase